MTQNVRTKLIRLILLTPVLLTLASCLPARTLEPGHAANLDMSPGELFDVEAKMRANPLWIRPVSSGDSFMGGPLAGLEACLDHTVVLLFDKLINGLDVSFVLPGGYYRPVHIDERGVYFQAPKKLVGRSGENVQLFVGGIYIPNEAKRYWSFIQFYIDLPEDSLPTLPISKENLSKLSPVLSLTRNGNFLSDMAKYPADELPMYGAVKRNDKMLEADGEFIRGVVERLGSGEKGSVYLAERGWESYNRDDQGTAIKRFNQAWLLDEKNSQAYYGCALVVSKRGRLQQGIRLMEKALELSPADAAVMSDLAYSYALAGQGYLLDKNLQDLAFLEKSEILFSKASALAPDKSALFAHWAVARYHYGDFTGAWQKVKRARELEGDKEIDGEFLKALQEKMPDPYAK